MTTANPQPSDLCECGHDRRGHSSRNTICLTVDCPCCNFRDAAVRPATAEEDAYERCTCGHERGWHEDQEGRCSITQCPCTNFNPAPPAEKEQP